jgi:Carbamoyl-phosphate synthase L chain, ATP binding domain
MNDATATPHPPARILFLSLANDLGCERIVAEMMKYGVECAVISPRRFKCMLLKGLAERYYILDSYGVRLGTLSVRRVLQKALEEWVPGLILPLDEPSAWLLRSLAVDDAATPALRKALTDSLGSAADYAATIGRHEFMQRAAQLGLRKPNHCVVDHPDDALAAARAWGYPVVLKSEHTTGGVGVTIINTPEELLASISRVDGRSWPKLLRESIKAEVYKRAGFQAWGRAKMILQSYAPGIPAFSTAAAWRGDVLCSVSFVAEMINPKPTGAATVVRKVRRADIDEATRRITRSLGCSGFVSYDFVLNEAEGHATIIEMNARSIGTTHLGAMFGADVCGALAEVLTGESWMRSKSNFELAALFPKELLRDPQSPYLASASVYHDVPEDQPSLVRAYLQEAELDHTFLKRVCSARV